MEQLNFAIKLSILIIVYVSLSILSQIVSSNQEIQPEEKLQILNEEDSNYLLNDHINKDLNSDLTNNDLLNSFDSSIYYKINWKKRPHDLVLNEGNESIVALVSKDLNKYHCVLPEIKNQEQIRKEDEDVDPYSKIEHLFNKGACIYKLDSYWTYEICLNDYVRQFNGDILEKKHTQEYFLGYFSAKSLEHDRQDYLKKVSELKKQGKNLPKIDYDGVKVPYVYLKMGKGTTCDLTNQPRSTTVYFVCDKNEKPQLESIEEIKSCEYEAIVSTSLLCDHPDFKEKKENELEINCFPNENENQPIKPIGLEQYETFLDPNSDAIIDQIREIFGKSKFKLELEALNTKIKTVDRSKFVDNLSKDMNIDLFIKAKNCFVSTFKSYWKYSFCFKKSIEMLHEEAGVYTQTIQLGKFDEDQHLNWLNMNPKKRKSSNEINYLFSDGDICHETNRMRYVEVKLKCPENDSRNPFSMTLEEPKICEYELTLESKLICKLIDLVDENGL